MKKLFVLLAVAALASTLQAAPKKLLVVTTTAGFRHSSIPTAEKILAQLAQSSGEFTVDFVRQPPGPHTANGFFPKLKDNATPDEKKTYDAEEAQFNAALKTELQKLSPENLKNYDGVIFASTTGDLPLPDKQGFLDWIKAGHAFIGIHAASDTFHGYPEFIAMLGGEFAHHGPQVSVECLNEDPENPATAALGKTWTIQQEEIYQFKNYDPAKVHDLLIMDKHPEHKEVNGRVFYTSLGHREDIWDADPTLKDRKNDPAISQAYQQHVLGGIEWALGLKPAAPTK